MVPGVGDKDPPLGDVDDGRLVELSGARAGLVGPDDTTYDYLAGRELSPKGEAWDRAVERWQALPSEDGASFDRVDSLVSYGGGMTTHLLLVFSHNVVPGVAYAEPQMLGMLERSVAAMVRLKPKVSPYTP